MKNDLKHKIYNIIQDFNLTTREIEPSLLLFEDLGFDALDYIELEINLENTFVIDIVDNDLTECKTVADVVKYIANKLI